MADPLELVAEVNEYLDSIDEKGQYEQARISVLEKYKTAMLEAGFNAPFTSMIAQARELGEDEDSADDMADRSKQVKRMRYIASLKKFTLNRLRVALAAHHLAQAMKDSGKPALASALPFGGSYVKVLSEAGEMAVEGYHHCMSLLQPRRFSVTGASALIRTEKGKAQSLDLDEEDVAASIKALAGGKTKIKELIIRSQKQSLIKNHSTRVALIAMAALDGAKKARALMDADEKADDQVAGYNRLLKKHGIVIDSNILVDDKRFEACQEEALKAGYLKKMPKSQSLMFDEELELKLFKRKQKHRHTAMNEAGAIVYHLLEWYYTCMHAEARKSYGAMPAVLAEPNEEQLSVLNHLQPHNHPLNHPAKIIFEKIQMEAKNPPLPSAVWGPAFLVWRAKLKPDWASAEFGVSEKEISDAVPLIRSLGEKSGRGTKFLEGLKKK